MDVDKTGSCPSEEQLEAYVSGAGTEDERAGIEAHLASCAHCRQYIDDSRANKEVFDSIQRVMRKSGSGSIPRNPQTGEFVIEGYEILEEIGRGGMGVVYKALQTSTRRVVALKVMLDGPLASETAKRRFEREIELAANLSHPNIIAIHDSGLSHDRYYFAMDYIAGQRLDHYIRQRDLPVQDRLELMQKVCQAIHYAHQRGVIHRDLKPSNILVDEQGQPHILDFGLAKTVTSTPGESLLISISGEVLGTLPYMAPEQARGEAHEIDCRTDVYALGVIFYELLTGKYPYPVAGQMAEVLKNIAESEPARPSTIYRAIKNDLETIVLKTLSKDKESRYESAGALAADIARYMAGEAIEAKRDSGWYVLRKTLRRYKWPAGIAAGFLLLAVGASIITFSLYRRAETAGTKALVEQQRAEQSARELAEELAGRTIQAGRDLAMAGEVVQAENLLWREFLQNPGDPLALWSLRELYAQQPCLGKVRASTAPVATLAFDPAGTTLVTADLQGVIKFWEMPACRHVNTMITQGPDITSVAVSPDGKRLAIASSNGVVRLLEVASGRVVYRWETVTAAVSGQGSGFGVQGSGFRSNDSNNGNKDQAEACTPSAPSGINCRPAYRVAFSPDGKRLAGCAGSDVQLWDVASGATLQRLTGHRAEVMTVAFSPDSQTLASGAKDHSIILWDLATKAPRATLISHLDNVSCVAFSPDGQTLASASWDGSAILWQVSNGACLASLEGFGCWVHSVAFSPDGASLATGDIHGNVRLWDLASGKCTMSIPAHVEGMQEALRPAVAVVFRPQGDVLASTAATGVVKLWDLARNRDMLKLTQDAGPVVSVDFAADGKTLTAGTPNGGGLSYDLANASASGATPALSAGVQPEVHASSAAGGPGFANDRYAVGSQAASASLPAHASDWDDPQFAQRQQVKACSPDGKWMAEGGSDGVRLWEAVSRRCLPGLPDLEEPVYSVAFSPDSRTLATAGPRAIRLWQVPSGRPVATLLGDGRLAWGLKFSPTGRLLACAGNAGVRVWDLGRYDRCLLGNYAYFLEQARQSAELAGRIRAEDVDRWAKSVAAEGEQPLWMAGTHNKESNDHSRGDDSMAANSAAMAPGVRLMESGGCDAALDISQPIQSGVDATALHKVMAPGKPGVCPDTIAAWGQLTRHRLLFSLRNTGYKPLEVEANVAGATDPPPATLTFFAGSSLTRRHTITPSGLSGERVRSAEYQQQRRSGGSGRAVASQPVAGRSSAG